VLPVVKELLLLRRPLVKRLDGSVPLPKLYGKYEMPEIAARIRAAKGKYVKAANS
jgi:hypothetical protein